MLHLLYALALLLLLSGACAILGEKSNLSPALLPLPILSGAVVVLYLCGVAGFLRVGAVAVLLALAAVWVVGLVQHRPAGVAAAWKRAASVPGFTLFLGGAASVSYTHLIVLRGREKVKFAKRLPPRGKLSAQRTDEGRAYGTVSYTHLDVYKRQVY